MQDYREDLGNELKRLNRSKAELSRATGIAYKRLSGFFCRYWFLSLTEERQVRSIISHWREEKERKEAVA